MKPLNLTHNAANYLHKLTVDIPSRRVGSAGNRAATDFFARTVAALGFDTDSPEFDCIDWEQSGAELTVGDESFAVQASPYSLGGQFAGPLVIVSTVAELEVVEATGRILLLTGELAQEQLMPKNFPFYNPEHHQHIISLLEAKQPLAIVAATSRNPETAGGLYPFPLIEDGDFDIPSVFMTEEEGAGLVKYGGNAVRLTINARRIPATGCNVIARKGRAGGLRLVVCAHIDAKIDTPGAIDNAAGVIVLLLLAELLQDYADVPMVEIVVFNGEDYYAASGEIQYLQLNEGRLADIILAVNIDAAGYKKGRTAYSLYGCPPELAESFEAAFAARPGMMAGEPWYQSDHSVFIQNGVPAAAITSEQFMELTTYITHTPQDSLEIVDPARLVEIAIALQELIQSLSES
jgi:aminopeptidase YwaD